MLPRASSAHIFELCPICSVKGAQIDLCFQEATRLSQPGSMKMSQIDLRDSAQKRQVTDSKLVAFEVETGQNVNSNGRLCFGDFPEYPFWEQRALKPSPHRSRSEPLDSDQNRHEKEPYPGEPSELSHAARLSLAVPPLLHLFDGRRRGTLTARISLLGAAILQAGTPGMLDPVARKDRVSGKPGVTGNRATPGVRQPGRSTSPTGALGSDRQSH